MSAVIKANDAVAINPPASDIVIRLTEHGSDWYWAAFSMFAVTTLGFVVSAAFVPRKERVFHYFSIAAAMFMSLTYFTMASNLGNTGIQTEFTHYMGGGIRQIFYARYIGWFLALPLVITNVLLFAGVAWPTVLFTLGSQEIYIVALLIGSLVESTYKWGYFVFGVIAWFLVMYHLIFIAAPAAKAQGSDIYKHTMVMISGVSFLWTLYPIAWGLSEGGNVIAPDSEGAFYGVLDVLNFIGLGAYFVYASRQISVERLGLSFERGFKHTAALPVSEKQAAYEQAAAAAAEPAPRHSGETAVNAETATA